MDHKDEKTILADIERQETRRERGFIAGTVGVVLGGVAGMVLGKKMLSKSLTDMLVRRFNMADWRGNQFEDFVAKFSQPVTEAHDYARHAASTTADMARAAHSNIHGDRSVISAFHQVVVSEPDFYTRARDAFLKARQNLQKNFEGRVRGLKIQLRENIHKGGYGKETVEMGNDVTKLMAWPHKYNALVENHIYHLDREFEDKFLRPVLRDMTKGGKGAGHMGHGLRHADNKEKILVFSAVAAVTVGFVAYKAVQWYLGRNDQRKEESAEAKEKPETFQARVTAERAAASQQKTGAAVGAA